MLLLIRSRGGYQDISKTKFTFHYASTYTLKYNTVYYYIHHLHSTMLLLIQYLCVNLVYDKVDLHSTMLLLIPVPQTRESFVFTFTFHYASTYTFRVQVYPFIGSRIYIPLCFYLYGITETII